MSDIKLALVQQMASEDKLANVHRGLEAVKTAARHGAQIIAFPELAFDRFFPQYAAGPNVNDLAEPIPGPTTDSFRQLAAELGVVIVLNVFELDGNSTFDTSPVINSDGHLLGLTRMIHITDCPRFHEQGYYVPGDRGVPVYDTTFGKIGVAICYDRHYPEYMRALALGGAEIVVVPQAGVVDEWPAGLYEAEMRVAAFQNGYFTALCNRVGQEDSLLFAGESFVCDPEGRVIAKAGQQTEEILYCDINTDQIAESHAKRLFFRDRRPELYASWLG